MILFLFIFTVGFYFAGHVKAAGWEEAMELGVSIINLNDER